MKRFDEVYLVRIWLEDVLLNIFKVFGGILIIVLISKSEEINMKIYVIIIVFFIVVD